MRKYKNLIYSLIWIFIFLGISSFIGNITKNDMLWYKSLDKSMLTPPSYVFPIAWTILYIMIALSGEMIWDQSDNKRTRRQRSLFIIYMFFNWSWSFIFFSFQMPLFAFIWIILSIITLASLIKKLYENAKFIEVILLTPTLLWSIFASYLNGYIAF